jgi:hypothetical protein
MTNRKLLAFVDALAAGRRPKRFRADADEAAMLQTAIELRAARPGEAQPSAAFTDRLFNQLSDQARSASAQEQAARPATKARPLRTRFALVATAAAVVLVGASAGTTVALTGSGGATTAIQVPQAGTIRTGTFQAADGQVLGQIVAYHGDPSWVFLTVQDPGYTGPVKCMLQVADGSTVAFATFDVANGSGQFSKNIGTVDFSHLRGAKLVSPAGEPVAAATFGI